MSINTSVTLLFGFKIKQEDVAKIDPTIRPDFRLGDDVCVPNGLKLEPYGDWYSPDASSLEYFLHSSCAVRCSGGESVALTKLPEPSEADEAALREIGERLGYRPQYHMVSSIY